MKFLISFVVISLIFCNFLNGATINVPADFSTIQEGVDNCAYGDTVLVAPGTYSEETIILNKEDKKVVLASHYLTTSDSLFVDSTIIFETSIQVEPWHAINFDNVQSEIIGFTIDGNDEENFGIEFRDIPPRIKNNKIKNFITGIKSVKNGIKCQISDNIISNCWYGIFALDAAMVATNNTFRYNKRGIRLSYNYNKSSNNNLDSIRVKDNLFEHNEIGLKSVRNSPMILNNIFRYNDIGFHILPYYGAEQPYGYSCLVMNNKIYKNFIGVINVCDGIYPERGKAYYNNNVIALNDSVGIINSSAYIEIQNSIIWDNEVNFGEMSQHSINPPSTTISYSNIEGGVPNEEWFINGAGNIDLDPQFVDIGNFDFHLAETSPCIDAGNIDPRYNDFEDPDNLGFPLYPAMGGLRNDMGAYGGNGTYLFDQENILIEYDTY